MKSLPPEYVKILSEHGRDLKELGVDGAALSKEYALKAIGILRGAKIMILGGDVLRVVNGRIQHTYDSWHYDDHVGLRDQTVVEASFKHAERYLLSYPDAEDGTILYEIGIS